MFLFSVSLTAQSTCSDAAITAKYWQYRQNLNKHFVATDRDPSGCVNDGIGQDATDSCKFSKAGYGLPATSIVQTPNGRFGLGSRSNEKANPPIFVAGLSSECMGETSLDDDGSDPNHKYNFLNVGSETLTQVGWHIVTLCTEYELLSKNGQTEQMQRTLEEIFLALQAIRRLDMQTQCLLEEMYNTRKNNPDNAKYMCEPPYTISSEPHPFGSGHVNFDSQVVDDCNFKANFSGYNGFFIREDATQQLEQILHDPTDETYNIDGVSSPFAQSTNEGGLCPPVDRFCYMAHDQNFISQDQVSNLLFGFSFIKRFIPANATVTTCDGTSYNVRNITTDITEALVFNIDDHNNHIVIPSSDDCCEKPVKLSMSAGGYAGGSIHGMIKAYRYITGRKRKSTLGQNIAYNAVTPIWPTRDKLYYTRFESVTGDLSNMNEDKRNWFTLQCLNNDVEIYLLANDIMFPEGAPVSGPIDVVTNFRGMLCEAPCAGPCSKGESHDDPNIPPDRLPNFSCPNTPNWLGSRWEAQEGGRPEKNPKDVLAEQRNGLDYMALFNMYAIKNNLNVPYYNPDLPPDSNNAIVNDQIDGPSSLCVGQTGTYALKRLYTVTPPFPLSDISWTSSNNMTVFSPTAESTDAKMNSKVDPSYVAVSFGEDRFIPQYYEGATINSTATPYPRVVETCTSANRKEIVSGMPEYTIQDNGFSFCGSRDYTLVVEGPDFPDNEYKWSFKNFINNSITTAIGKSVTIQVSTSQYSYGEISVEVVTDCGSVIIKKNVNFMECPSGLGGGGADNSILVFPNPGRDEISMAFTQDNYEIPPNGIPIRIVRANGGQVVRTERVYSKISTINTSTLMNGSYNIQATTPEFGILNSSFIISRD
jgi:hypothetical protein